MWPFFKLIEIFEFRALLWKYKGNAVSLRRGFHCEEALYSLVCGKSDVRMKKLDVQLSNLFYMWIRYNEHVDLSAAIEFSINQDVHSFSGNIIGNIIQGSSTMSWYLLHTFCL